MKAFQDLVRALRRVDESAIERHNNLVRHVNRLGTQQTSLVQRQQLDAMKEILAQAYGQASNYSNLIIVAGYVGFYSMWSSVRTEMPQGAMVTAGLLITISALFFVAFEIYKMIRMSLHFRVLVRLLHEGGASALERVQSEEQRFSLRLAKAWVVALVLTVVPGFAAAAILVVCFAQKLLGTGWAG